MTVSSTARNRARTNCYPYNTDTSKESIVVRMEAALTSLATTNASGGWGTFLLAEPDLYGNWVRWNDTVLSGISAVRAPFALCLPLRFHGADCNFPYRSFADDVFSVAAISGTTGSRAGWYSSAVWRTAKALAARTPFANPARCWRESAGCRLRLRGWQATGKTVPLPCVCTAFHCIILSLPFLGQAAREGAAAGAARRHVRAWAAWWELLHELVLPRALQRSTCQPPLLYSLCSSPPLLSSFSLSSPLLSHPNQHASLGVLYGVELNLNGAPGGAGRQTGQRSASQGRPSETPEYVRRYLSTVLPLLSLPLRQLFSLQ